MKLSALPLAAILLFFANACTSTPKSEPLVCVSKGPDASSQAEIEGLDRDHIACVINRDAMGKARRCYEAMLEQPGATNEPIRVLTRFRIEPSGLVERAESESPAGTEKLAACVTATMRTLKFEKPFGNTPVKVVYPFSFRRSSDGGRETIFDN